MTGCCLLLLLPCLEWLCVFKGGAFRRWLGYDQGYPLTHWWKMVSWMCGLEVGSKGWRWSLVWPGRQGVLIFISCLVSLSGMRWAAVSTVPFPMHFCLEPANHGLRALNHEPKWTSFPLNYGCYTLRLSNHKWLMHIPKRGSRGNFHKGVSPTVLRGAGWDHKESICKKASSYSGRLSRRILSSRWTQVT